MCLEIYELALARSFTALELALQAALKKTKVKLQLLIDIDKLLIVKKKGVRSRIYHTIHQYGKYPRSYL